MDMIHHRSSEFKTIFQRVLRKLKIFFQTQEPVLIQNSTGTGAMESALLNTLSPGDKVICIVSGRFGERWHNIAQNYSLKVLRLDVPPGKPLELKKLQKLIEAHKKDLSALLFQASETSSATLHPTREISELLSEMYSQETQDPNFSQTSLSDKKSPFFHPGQPLSQKFLKRPLIIVDAMTALGVTYFPMDEWDLDVVMTSSQKALMLPPGISFLSLSKRAWHFYKTSRFPKFYFDLKKELEANQKGFTQFSSAVLHIIALDAVLERVASKKEDLMQMIKECERRSKIVRRFLRSIQIEPFSEVPSPAVTAFKIPHIDSSSFNHHLKSKYNVSFASGDLGLIRIGHMGFIQDEDLKASLEAVGQGLLDLSPSSLKPQTLKQALKNLKQDLIEI